MRNDFKEKALHLFALSALALAQPFFHVLGGSGTFLIAHNVGPTDLILLTFVLTAGFPLLFIFITFLSGLWSKNLREGIFISIFVFLSGLTALPITKDIPSYSGFTQIILALLIGLIAYVLYRRYQHVKLFLKYLAPLVFFFPVNFLFLTDTSKLLFPSIQENRHPPSTLTEESKIPIFLIVLDELPITSLMDEYGNIDSVRYPNFNELSKTSNWFRNATAVSEWTDMAVPAILTGKYPSEVRTLVPLEEDYPDNLFTLMEPHYEFKVFEELTKLCFSEKCGKPQLSELPERTLNIYSDLMVLFGHSVLPADYSKEIPSIHNKWRNFKSWNKDGRGNIYDDRIKRVENFIGSINSQNKSTLYFLHLTLPHSPTIYFPSGKAYAGTEDMIIGRQPEKDMWTLDSWMVTQAYQRHLLQLGYTDKLLGQIVGKMKQKGLYDKALLIVTADHGISFLPGQRARGYTQFNYSDILSVPLFIKLPHQKESALRTEAVKTIDILPAIAATIGLQVPWTMDGENPLSSKTDTSRNKDLVNPAKLPDNRYVEMLKLPTSPEMKYKALKKKYFLFGSGPQEQLYKIGPRPDLLGLKTEDALNRNLIASVETELDQSGNVVWVDKQANFIPAWITGRVKNIKVSYTSYPKNLTLFMLMGKDMRSNIAFNSFPQNLAVAVNGVIQATTQTGYFSSLNQFSALVPEKSFIEGSNTISVFKILDRNTPMPHPKKADLKNHSYPSNNESYIWNKNKTQYRLIQNPGQSSSIVDSHGNIFKIHKKSIGVIEQARYSLEAIYFFGQIKGWNGPKDKILFLVYNHDQLVFSDHLIIPEFLDTNQLKASEETIRPVFRIPVYQNKKVDLNNIRIFLMDTNTGIHEMEVASGILAYPEELIPKHQFYGALSYCEDERMPFGNKSRTPEENIFPSECF